MLALGVSCVALLAFANGANDNFKGVSTLFGSGISDYRAALAWATATTLLGSVAAVALSAGLVQTFSGKLFVSAATLALPGFGVAVCAACAATVLIATRLGAPVSTTHALAGALIGAALAAPAGAIGWSQAGRSIFLPLALGPLLSIAAALLLYPLATRLRAALGIDRASCVCVGEQWIPQGDGTALARIAVAVDVPQVCRERYQGAVLGVSTQALLDGLHYLSAGVVSFARGVNDTPKIVALALLAAPLAGDHGSRFVAVGLCMALGGLLAARRVAETLARKITPLNPGQGLTANLITATLVLAASPLGLPLSTTHVSVGALLGIGAVTRQARWRTALAILGAWMVTLPLAALLGAAAMRTTLWMGT